MPVVFVGARNCEFDPPPSSLTLKMPESSHGPDVQGGVLITLGCIGIQCTLKLSQSSLYKNALLQRIEVWSSCRIPLGHNRKKRSYGTFVFDNELNVYSDLCSLIHELLQK